MRTTDRSGSLSGELDLAAEVIQSSEQAPDRLGAVAASEVIGAKIFVFVLRGLAARGNNSRCLQGLGSNY
jgi:hypothetical protein